jgi:hypothetical protein
VIKVFRINDCDWLAGEDFESALVWYMGETGLTREEALDGSEHELTPKEMEALKYFIDDEDELCAHGVDPSKVTCLKISFQAELEHMEESKQTFPCLFASTEY